MRVNSVNGGRKKKKKRRRRRRRERERERQGKWGAKIRPPHLNSAKLLSQLNLTKLTQSTPPKKKKFFMKREGSY